MAGKGYIDRKRDTRKFLRRSIEEGLYQIKEIPATDTQAKRTQNEDDLMGDDLKQYEPEWYKYVTNVRLVKNLKEDTYDMLFDYLQQHEGLVNASRAKRAAKTHDPLALVANTYANSSSSRSPVAYYVTHPSYVVDYDDDYQGDAVCDDQEDSLTAAMMLLACAITQCYSTPTNDRL
nr:hypothetical protein [Tanacetum cinerariifolium]